LTVMVRILILPCIQICTSVDGHIESELYTIHTHICRKFSQVPDWDIRAYTPGQIAYNQQQELKKKSEREFIHRSLQYYATSIFCCILQLKVDILWCTKYEHDFLRTYGYIQQ